MKTICIILLSFCKVFGAQVKSSDISILSKYEHKISDKSLILASAIVSNKNLKQVIEEHEKWLKTFDSKNEDESYHNKILDIIQDSKKLNKIMRYVFGKEKGVTLSEEQKIGLIIICLERYVLTNKFCLRMENENITKNFYNWTALGSKLYFMSGNEALLLWCNGGGAHNGQYSICIISFKNDIFNFKQLEIPYFIDAKDEISVRNNILSNQYSKYADKKKLLIIKTNDGVFGQNGVSKHFYKIKDDKLILIRYIHDVRFDPLSKANISKKHNDL